MYRSNITICCWRFIFTFGLITETWIRCSSIIMFLVERVWFCNICHTMIFCFFLDFRTSCILMWPIHNICVSFSQSLILILKLFRLKKLTVSNILLRIWRHCLFWLRRVIRFFWDRLISLFFYTLFNFLRLLNRLTNLICWSILLNFVLKWLISCLTARCWNI